MLAIVQCHRVSFSIFIFVNNKNLPELTEIQNMRAK